MSKSAFKIPLQTEVSDYMVQKRGWTKAFCDYYAEKFWNHYQAAGWRLSNGNPMKDWQAAFNATWQNLKFKEDIDTFNRLEAANKISVFREQLQKGEVGDEWEQLDALLAKYKQHPTSVPFESFGPWYPVIAEAKMLRKFTNEERQAILQAYEGDLDKCKCAAVQQTFDSYVMSGVTFGHIIKVRQQLNGSNNGK